MSNASLKVKIFDSKGTQVLQIGKSALTIGSASHCDVVVDHPTVHSEHARAWLEGGRVWVQDLGGEHGTALNEIRLPGLKPMLVRELDVLRLGQFDATIGLEPNLVRAPVVNKARISATPEEPPKNVLKDAEYSQRKTELENLSRELANIRLQVQMAKLEKNSQQEATDQKQNLSNEIRVHQEQKRKWNESMRQIEQEKQQQRQQLEAEIQSLKARLAKDTEQINRQLESERRQRLEQDTEIKSLRAKLERAPAPELVNEHQTMKIELKTLREQESRQRETLEDEIKTLRAKLERAPTPELASEYQTLKAELRSLRDKEARQREALESEIRALRTKLEQAPTPELVVEHQALKNELRALREKEARHRQALEEELKSLRVRLEKAPTAELVAEHQALKNEVKQLREQKQEWSQTENRENRQRQELEGEITALRTRLDKSPSPELLQQHQTLKNEILFLREEHRRVLDAETRHRESLEAEIQALQSKLERSPSPDLVNEHQALRQEFKQLEGQKLRWLEVSRELEEERQARKNAENEIRALKAQLESEVKALNEQNRRLKESNEAELKALRARLEKSPSPELVNDYRALQAEIKSYRDQSQRWNETTNLLNREREQRGELEDEIRALKAQLDKSPSPELTKEHQALRGELEGERKILQEHKRKLGEMARQLDEQRKQSDERLGEIKALKSRLDKSPSPEVMIELKALKSEKSKWQEMQRKLEAQLETQQEESENEKRLQVGQLAKNMRAVSSTLVKRWSTRPLSQDMIFEWEGEMTQIFRRVLLNEKDDESTLPEARSLPEVEPIFAAARTPRMLRKILVGTAGAAFVIALLLLAWFKQGGQLNLSSTTPPAKPVARQPAARFEPKLSRKYRGTYTDNVLYLENYVEAEQNLDFRKRWMAELNKTAVKDWKMDEWSMAPVAVKEVSLIKDLNRIKNGILTTDQEVDGVKKMRAREALFQKELEEIFKSRASVDRYLKFKRAFYIRNQAYLSKETI